MADTGWVSASGSGVYDIAGSVNLPIVALEYRVDSITSSRVRILSTDFPRRLQYAGSMGILYTTEDDGTYPSELMFEYSLNINWERQFEYILNLYKYGSHMFWLLPLGVSAHLKAYW